MKYFSWMRKRVPRFHWTFHQKVCFWPVNPWWFPSRCWSRWCRECWGLGFRPGSVGATACCRTGTPSNRGVCASASDSSSSETASHILVWVRPSEWWTFWSPRVCFRCQQSNISRGSTILSVSEWGTQLGKEDSCTSEAFRTIATPRLITSVQLSQLSVFSGGFMLVVQCLVHSSRVWDCALSSQWELIDCCCWF